MRRSYDRGWIFKSVSPCSGFSQWGLSDIVPTKKSFWRTEIIEAKDITGFPAALFPHVSLPESAIARIVNIFRPVTLFKPWFMDVPAPLKNYLEAGAVRVLYPPEALKPREDFEKVLKSYRNWCTENPDGGHVAFLAAQQRRDSVEDTTWGIRGSLRRTEGEKSSPGEPPALKWHLLLHMARQIEEESREAERLLRDLKERKSPLQDILGTDEDQGVNMFDDLPPFQSEPSMSEFHWDQVFEAWLGLFGGYLAETDVLLTIDHRVLDFVWGLRDQASLMELRRHEAPVRLRLPVLFEGLTGEPVQTLKEGPAQDTLLALESLIAGPGLSSVERMSGLRHLAGEIASSSVWDLSKGSVEVLVAPIDLPEEGRQGRASKVLTPFTGKTIVLIDRIS